MSSMSVAVFCFLCCHTGGSLLDVITEKEQQGEFLKEPELKDLLLQVSMGLKYIHSLGLVHLDIKPSKSVIFWFSVFVSVTLKVSVPSPFLLSFDVPPTALLVLTLLPCL